MPRRVYGRQPKAEDGWVHLCDIEDGQMTWAVYERRQDEWTNIKIAARGRAHHKGNFWLSWRDGAQYRRYDNGRLEELRPDLCKQVYDMMRERLGADLI